MVSRLSLRALAPSGAADGDGTFWSDALNMWVAAAPAIAAANVSFPPTGTISASNVQDALDELDSEKAPKVSPTFTGTVAVPDQAAGDNSGKAANTKYVDAAVAAGGGGGGSGTGKDRRWNVGTGETSIDEFNDDTLGAAWARVDGTGAAVENLAITEGADVVSLTNAGGDTAACIHGLVQPLSGVGGSLVAGDGFVTCVTLMAPSASFAFAGLLLADGQTFGAGNQVTATVGRTSSAVNNAETWAMTGYNARSATASLLQYTEPKVNYLRLALIAANTWRADASPDGISWIKGPTTLSKTMTPTHVGLCSSSYGTSTKHIASFEFVRRVSGVT